MTTQPYQGYPYIKPYVTEAPSIDAATASRWNNLPRRPVQPPTNVVYVDLPDEGGSQVVWRSDTPTTKQVEKMDLIDLDAPVIYVDVQESGDSEVASPASENSSQESQWNASPNPARKKPEDLDAVIYIDLPGSSSSDVTTPAEPEEQPEFVQETIFYDPFENRRIVKKEAETDSEASTSPRPARPAPARPTELPLTNTTGYGLPSCSHGPPPASESYARDGLPDTIPVSQFPEPPPAYSECTPHTPHITPHTPNTQCGAGVATEPPRTVVITAGSEQNRPPTEVPLPIGLPSPDRKVVNCHYCGLRVHTLVIWEAGPITHAIALVLTIFMLVPLVIMVYCTNCFKYKNHYCPSCNNRIGYEAPGLCVNMKYTKKAERPTVLNGIWR